MTPVGIHRLEPERLIPKWWKPLTARAVPSAIPSSTTGKAQIRSKKREMIQSVTPPK
jgi:hypothetical protein